ncbi:MAG TPA: bifunctional phosphoribosylaminoimidazolecarboxamide formyltransferase/IMP cyclohydrolase [Phycisphaerales bacterium]|nr:bifunctional phosphoribosylaminoimidazolecarboxamide formyltransferase/IMP cyclohydrolase [Phycisphaerales bacterium]
MNRRGTISRALISVSDKQGITGFARALADLGIEIISTGGTAKALADAGLRITPVQDITGFPEMLSGRVKTLHPNIHGGILGRRDNPSHIEQMDTHGILPIDLVVIDLYPFERTIARESTTLEEAIEQIDIGGPAMIRSAAKNFNDVTVITDPADYDAVIEELKSNNGCTSDTLRRELATKAFARTAEYDTTIAQYLQSKSDVPLPDRISISLKLDRHLRYGENPHQYAALYRTAASQGGILDAEQLHGKPLSANNIGDAAAAWALVELTRKVSPDIASAVIVKHANPCGAAVAENVSTAVDAAFAGDPLAAFGGILATNRTIDDHTARRLTAEGVFLEIVAAPDYEPDALERLRARWKNIRLLRCEPASPQPREIRLLPGGALVQTPDDIPEQAEPWTLAAGPEPGESVRQAARLLEAWTLALLSNAVAIGGIDPDRPGCIRLFGVGAGQVDRVSACTIAVKKAGDLARGAIAFSDAFFPFSDGPTILADAGVGTIVHPGGSKRDDETFTLCEQRGISCLITGRRHFRHTPLH